MSDNMPLRRGVCRQLEAEADRMIKQSLAGTTSRAAKSDILTPWKEMARRQHELFVVSGTPDPAVRSGNFHRALNRGRPELNSREGVARPRVDGGLSTFVAEYGYDQSLDRE